MVYRTLNISGSSSFFLFGARGTGKTTFLEEFFKDQRTVNIDLLLPTQFHSYSRNPELLLGQADEAVRRGVGWIVIDEVQKAPQLLDVVHHLIEKKKLKFALTGSSARKLRRGSSNLLAGRAFSYSLFPLTASELDRQFNLHQTLLFGSLPKLLQYEKDSDRSSFLESYALTYLQEEIWNEHLIRNLSPFQRFLEVAAQMNGEVINFSRISNEVGADDKTIKNYFEILVDTLVGVLLPAYDKSVRKQQTQSPKFYFFDCGVKRALDGTIRTGIIEGSPEYGRAFEHFIILELIRESSYLQNNFKFSYLRTKDDAEIDLVITRPKQPTALIEIKSTKRIQSSHLRSIHRFAEDIKNSEAFCLSNDPIPRLDGKVRLLPWKEGIKEILLSPTEQS